MIANGRNLKYQVAMPLEVNGVVQGHMMDWIIRLTAFLGPFGFDKGASGDVPHARNLLVHRFLKGDADILWFVDSDMDPRLGSSGAEVHGGVPYVVEAMKRDDVDILSGISFRLGSKGPVPCINAISEGKKALLDRVLAKEKGLVDGTGFETGGACLVIKRHVLEGFIEKRKVWFENELEHDDPRRFGLLNLSEDYHFIRTAQELGFRFWIDTRVCWGHIKPRDLREELWTSEAIIEEAERKPPKRLVEVARG